MGKRGSISPLYLAYLYKEFIFLAMRGVLPNFNLQGNSKSDSLPSMNFRNFYQLGKELHYLQYCNFHQTQQFYTVTRCDYFKGVMARGRSFMTWPSASSSSWV